MNSQRGRGGGRGSRTVRGSRGGHTGDVSSPIQKNSSPILSRKSNRESSQDRNKNRAAATLTVSDETDHSLLVLIEDEAFPQYDNKILPIPVNNIIEEREKIAVKYFDIKFRSTNVLT